MYRLDIYLQRHSPLLPPELWLRYSRLSARYTGRHWHRDVPRAGIPHIPYLLAYPSGSSPALGSRRKNSAGGVNLK